MSRNSQLVHNRQQGGIRSETDTQVLYCGKDLDFTEIYLADKISHTSVHRVKPVISS